MRSAPSRIRRATLVGVRAGEHGLVDLHHPLHERRVAPHLLQELRLADGGGGGEGDRLGPVQVLVVEGLDAVAVEAEQADDLALDQERDARPRADELGPFDPGVNRVVVGDVGEGQRAQRPWRSASWSGWRKVRPRTLAGSGKPRAAMMRNDPSASSSASEQESKTTIRASCFRTSSIVSSRLGLAVDGLQDLAQRLRFHPALALRLHRRVRAGLPAPLARDLLAHGVQRFRPVRVGEVGQPLLDFAEEAVGVHGRVRWSLAEPPSAQ